MDIELYKTDHEQISNSYVHEGGCLLGCSAV
jgi:hypothetical protein